MENGEFNIQSYNQKELANHYGVAPKTLRRWLKRLRVDLGTRIGNYYSPRQVKIIVEQLGRPFIWIAMLTAKLLGMDMDHDHDHHDDSDGGLGTGKAR